MRRSLALTLAGSFFTAALFGATYTVTSPADAGAGTLREAITNANLTVATADTIAFNIAGAGVHTITPTSALPDLTSPVTIDGYTQAGSSPNTAAITDPINSILTIELNCVSVPAGSPCLRIGADNVTIRGLVVNRSAYFAIVTDFFKSIQNAVIEGCYLGTNAAGTAGLSPFAGGPYFGQHKNARIGGTTAAARNLIASTSTNSTLIGLSYAPDAGSVIQGNFLGTDRTGAARANILESETCIILIGGASYGNGSGYTVGGLAAGAGNVMACRDFGVRVSGAVDVTIQGNRIGVDRTGTLTLGRGQGTGILLETGGTALIGGTGAGAGNVIGGHFFGINAGAPVSPIVIQGNWIGTDVTGTRNLGNSSDGINASGSAQIGGTASGEANQILYNGRNGVGNTSIASGVSIRGNRMYGNTALGINLGSAGPNANDDDDPDTGPNGLQNAPIIASAAPEAGGTRVIGTLNSTPSSPFTIDFYANPACRFRSRSQVEADEYLGSTNVSTNSSGDAAINVLLATPITAGQPVTATATAGDDSTSELSPEIVFSSTPEVGNADAPPQLTIKGMLFSGAPTVTIGGVAATGVTLESSTEIRATAPILPPGAVYDVVVSIPGGPTGRLRNGYVTRFADANSISIFDAAIHKLVGNGITVGCGVGIYCPNNSVTRAEMAIFLDRGKRSTCFNPPNATGTVFSDVPANGFGAKHIEQIERDGITTGCGGGKYCPNDPVTRDQMAVFLLRSLLGSNFKPQDPTGTMFTDVPASHPYARWIEELSRRNITTGCGGGKYCPGNTNTRGEMAVFINRTYGLP